MSYSISFSCFSKTQADSLWTEAELQSVKDYDDEELMLHDLELGSMTTFSPEDSSLFLALLEVHNIPYDDCVPFECLVELFRVLDKAHIRSVVAEDDVYYQADIQANFDDIVAVAKDFVDKNDPPSTEYSIEGLEKYMTPLFAEVGIFLYSKVTREQLVEFLDMYTDEVKNCALDKMLQQYNAAISRNMQFVIEMLQDCKKFVSAVQGNPDCLYVFSDDYDIYPKQIFLERLPAIKARASNMAG